MKDIKIFLASSSELVDLRVAFDLFLRRKNDYLQSQQIDLKVVVWENLDSAVSLLNRKQNDYNEQIGTCDILVSVFYTKAGKYTREEFQVAYDLCMSARKPYKIYTYFLKSDHKEPSLEAFRKYLHEVIQHFEDQVESEYHLLFHFSEQLNRYLASVVTAPADYSDTQYLEQQAAEKINQLENPLRYNNEATYSEDTPPQNNFDVTCSLKSMIKEWKLSRLHNEQKAQLRQQDALNKSGDSENYSRIYERLDFVEKADFICECLRSPEAIDPCFDITFSNYANIPFHLLSVGFEVIAGGERIISGGDYAAAKIEIQDHYCIDFPTPTYISIQMENMNEEVVFSLPDNPAMEYLASKKGDSRSIICSGDVVATDGTHYEINDLLKYFDFTRMPVTVLSDLTNPVLIPPFSPYRFTIKIANSEHIPTDTLLRFVFIGGGKQVVKTENIYFFKV